MSSFSAHDSSSVSHPAQPVAALHRELRLRNAARTADRNGGCHCHGDRDEEIHPLLTQQLYSIVQHIYMYTYYSTGIYAGRSFIFIYYNVFILHNKFIKHFVEVLIVEVSLQVLLYKLILYAIICT